MSLKIGILGTGNIARGNYIPCLAAEEDVSLGYYTRTRAKAEAVAEEFGGEVFDSLASLVSWGPDSTLVLTGEMDRYDAATALLARFASNGCCSAAVGRDGWRDAASHGHRRA